MPTPSFVIIIPARYASSRYPGKPLAPLKGVNGVRKTLIERSWDCAQKVTGHSGVWVATDDERIAAEVERFGGQCVMTSVSCANGTERCAEAISRLGLVVDAVVNFQGDAPLSPSAIVSNLVSRLEEDIGAVMSTPVVRCSTSVYEHLLSDAEAGRVGGTTVIFNSNSRALYFSKRIIPFIPQDVSPTLDVPVYLHLGIYAYRPEALAEYKNSLPSEVEILEGLEQLRFLHLGMPVSVVEIEPPNWDSIELNNPSDTMAIERVLAQRGID